MAFSVDAANFDSRVVTVDPGEVSFGILNYDQNI